jgi:hypothetical protein
MTEVLINNFEYIMKMRERVILGLFAVGACFLIGYGFLMEKTIVNTVALTAIQSTLAHQNQTVSNLSGQYVALSRNVTLDSALAQGFEQAPVSTFVTVPPPTPVSSVLSVNIRENAF